LVSDGWLNIIVVFVLVVSPCGESFPDLVEELLKDLEFMEFTEDAENVRLDCRYLVKQLL
jgi:hypothetical protein